MTVTVGVVKVGVVDTSYGVSASLLPAVTHARVRDNIPCKRLPK